MAHPHAGFSAVMFSHWIDKIKNWRNMQALVICKGVECVKEGWVMIKAIIDQLCVGYTITFPFKILFYKYSQRVFACKFYFG